MTSWICATCAVEYPDSPQPPERCPICSDERQYVRPTGQRWTTLADLEGRGHRGSVAEVEPGLLGIEIEPSVGIGQRALLVQTPEATSCGIRPATSTTTWSAPCRPLGEWP